MKNRIRKMVAVLTATTLTAGLLTGCGGAKGGSSKGDEKELNICIWDGIFSEEAIKKFEKDKGCTVNITYIENTDTMLSKLVEGGNEYDLCDIEAAYVKSFVDNGLLQEIDHSAIPNEQYEEPSLLEKGPIGDEDYKYTTADSNAGYTAIVYNTETCPIKIDSFDDLADPALEGQVAMVNSTISLYGAALSALGYSPASTKEEEIAEANELLVSIKKNVKAFVGESAVSALENGECSVALCWDYSVLCFDDEANWDKFAIADIDSDYEKFVQYWGIPAGSTKKELAQEFINYMISPEAVAMHIDDWGQIPMVQREYIEEYLPEGFYDNPCIVKYEELADKSWLIAVDDEQINIMDKYYTLLMGGK
ncbi:MAG: extracellular solute-binding protein [Lachnospiraceae bacterium]|nr:extracellular solute-binding protein [Lachnospiraceae bacterium]